MPANLLLLCNFSTYRRLFSNIIVLHVDLEVDHFLNDYLSTIESILKYLKMKNIRLCRHQPWSRSKDYLKIFSRPFYKLDLTGSKGKNYFFFWGGGAELLSPEHSFVKGFDGKKIQIMRKISSNLMRNHIFSHDIDDFFNNSKSSNLTLEHLDQMGITLQQR